MFLPKGYILVLFVGILVYCFSKNTVQGSAINGDGFNLYKDLLRGKNEEFNEIGDDDGGLTRVTYFYRTPAAAYSEFGSEIFGKRSNKFKNFMLNREGLEGSEDIGGTSKFYFPRTLPKRGALLSWAIPAANRVRVVNTSYRPPGINRPAAAE
ncbi:uncharacterized protein LOC129798647 [Phlebotomus papatasi]|uniref:uncharacterized protein LOC129798647 n=1 Tax=Phlebotomus papatasi TaxID=29031 RepID=UPI002483541B|nr:uncharacterized protein LOC129798647 [Phlebotomus papatasi]